MICEIKSTHSHGFYVYGSPAWIPCHHFTIRVYKWGKKRNLCEIREKLEYEMRCCNKLTNFAFHTISVSWMHKKPIVLTWRRIQIARRTPHVLARPVWWHKSWTLAPFQIFNNHIRRLRKVTAIQRRLCYLVNYSQCNLLDRIFNILFVATIYAGSWRNVRKSNDANAWIWQFTWPRKTNVSKIRPISIIRFRLMFREICSQGHWNKCDGR